MESKYSIYSVLGGLICYETYISLINFFEIFHYECKKILFYLFIYLFIYSFPLIAGDPQYSIHRERTGVNRLVVKSVRHFLGIGSKPGGARAWLQGIPDDTVNKYKSKKMSAKETFSGYTISLFKYKTIDDEPLKTYLSLHLNNRFLSITDRQVKDEDEGDNLVSEAVAASRFVKYAKRLDTASFAAFNQMPEHKNLLSTANYCAKFWKERLNPQEQRCFLKITDVQRDPNEPPAKRLKKGRVSDESDDSDEYFE